MDNTLPKLNESFRASSKLLNTTHYGCVLVSLATALLSQDIVLLLGILVVCGFSISARLARNQSADLVAYMKLSTVYCTSKRLIRVCILAAHFQGCMYALYIRITSYFYRFVVYTYLFSYLHTLIYKPAFTFDNLPVFANHTTPLLIFTYVLSMCLFVAFLQIVTLICKQVILKLVYKYY